MVIYKSCSRKHNVSIVICVWWHVLFLLNGCLSSPYSSYIGILIISHDQSISIWKDRRKYGTCYNKDRVWHIILESLSDSARDDWCFFKDTATILTEPLWIYPGNTDVGIYKYGWMKVCKLNAKEENLYVGITTLIILCRLNIYIYLLCTCTPYTEVDLCEDTFVLNGGHL